MPFTWQININKSKGGAGYVFAPSPLSSVAIGDQVIWTNNDDKPHWPGIVSASEVAGTGLTYLMPYQIPAHTSSTTFCPGVAGTITYVDSLDPSATRPSGSIVVTATGAPAPSTDTIAAED